MNAFSLDTFNSFSHSSSVGVQWGGQLCAYGCKITAHFEPLKARQYARNHNIAAFAERLGCVYAEPVCGAGRPLSVRVAAPLSVFAQYIEQQKALD